MFQRVRSAAESSMVLSFEEVRAEKGSSPLPIHQNREPVRLYVTAIGAPRGAPDPAAVMLSFSF